MHMKTICLDLTNIIPGVGGAGGGIATYGRSIVNGLDAILVENPEFCAKYKIIVLLNQRTRKNLKFKKIRSLYFNVNNQNIIDRMIWLNFRLPKYLKKAKVDLLHRVVSELPYRKVCKTVVTVHDFMFDFYLEDSNFSKYLKFKEVIKFRILNKLLYASLIKANKLLVASSALKMEILQKATIDSDKIEVIPLAYESASINSDLPEVPKLQLNGKIRFGVVAAFHPHKGHFKVLQLAKKMVDLGFEDQIHFSFRGSPIYENYYQEVQDLIEELDLEHIVTFEKYDPNLSLKEIYKKYSATILLSDYEGFGLPVLESQAFQIPVICSELPVFNEILGDSAIYLPTATSDEDVYSLFKKLRDRDFIQELIDTGNKNAARFSWKDSCEKLFSGYLNLLGVESNFLVKST